MLNIDVIQARYDAYVRAMLEDEPGPAKRACWASANDVPHLLAEIRVLRERLDNGGG